MKKLSFMFVLSSLCFSACQPLTVSSTLSPAAVFTQAAGTAAVMIAQQATEQAALPPTSTSTTPPLATATLHPAALALPPTASLPTQALTTEPPAVPVVNAPAILDKATWVAQTPTDKSVLAPGGNFNLIWTVKNEGNTTWNEQYQVRYYAGTQLAPVTAYALGKTVLPGEQLEISLPFYTPLNAGDYQTVWVLTNAEGRNFYTLYFQFSLQSSIIPSATVTPYLPLVATTAVPTATTEPTLTPSATIITDLVR